MDVSGQILKVIYDYSRTLLCQYWGLYTSGINAGDGVTMWFGNKSNLLVREWLVQIYYKSNILVIAIVDLTLKCNF